MIKKLEFDKVNILVIGDVMLDIYKYGTVSRISPEAPVPVVLASNENNKAGGAGNVALNLKHLGCTVDLIGYIGNDYAGQQLIDIMRSNEIDHNNLIKSTFPTITKTRILTDKQHMIRYDEDSFFTTPIHRNIYEDILIEKIRNLNRHKMFDAVIISDYAKGTITDNVIKSIKSWIQNPIICDIKPSNGHLYYDVFCIVPNLKEAEELIFPSKSESIASLATSIKNDLNLQSVVITLGQDGIFLLDEQNRSYMFKANADTNKDVTGAGDTVISTLAACIAAGYALPKAVKLSNLAAGIVVGKTGTATCTIEELRNAYLQL